MRFLLFAGGGADDMGVVCEVPRDRREAVGVGRLESDAEEAVKDRSGTDVGGDDISVNSADCVMGLTRWAWALKYTGEFGGCIRATSPLCVSAWTSRGRMMGWPLGGSMVQEERSWLAAQRGLAVGSAENAGSSYNGECLSLLTAPSSGVGCTPDDVFVTLNCINPTGVGREWGGRRKWETIRV